ncbi:hypothetical protein MHBO_003700, partial [Bonamia ostreae]
MAKIPLKEEMPSNLQNFETFCNSDNPRHLLIIFHGLVYNKTQFSLFRLNFNNFFLIWRIKKGDNTKNYISLAKKMQLPKTCSIALNAPEALPFGLGFSWFTSFDAEANLIKPEAFEERRISSLAQTRIFVFDFLKVLVDKCGWKERNIYFLGFSQ